MLTSEQIDVIRGLLRDYINGIISGEKNYRLRIEWLTLLIEEELPNLKEAMFMLKQNNELIKNISDLFKSKAISENIQADWKLFTERLKAGDFSIPQEVMERLGQYPNFNPILLADMIQFRDKTKNSTVKIQLNQARALFLGMNLVVHSNDGEDLPQFSFFPGKIPHNLHSGFLTSDPLEIRPVCKKYIEEALETEHRHQLEMKEIESKHHLEKLQNESDKFKGISEKAKQEQADHNYAMTLHQKEVVELQSSSASSSAQLDAALHAAHGEFAQSLNSLEISYKAKPSAEISIYKAAILYQLGNKDQALRCLEESYKIEPTSNFSRAERLFLLDKLDKTSPLDKEKCKSQAFNLDSSPIKQLPVFKSPTCTIL